jgi:hypothetical protein
MGNNQHRWRESIGDEVLGVIDDAKGQLAWAWKTDASWDYPVHTDQALFEIKAALKKDYAQSNDESPSTPTKLRLKRTIKSLSELVSERTIELVYESQNSDTYNHALNCTAFARDESAFVSFGKLLNAIEKAYEIDKFGIERFPKPRIHLLHRRLLELANQIGISDLTHSGILEFLNDLCPCGKKHTFESIRKLRERTRLRRPKTVQRV